MRAIRILLLLAAVAMAAPAATISLNFSSQSLVVGQTFTVDVYVSDVFGGFDVLTDSLTGFGANSFIDTPSAVQFVSVGVGSLFDDFSGSFGGNPQVAGLASDLDGLQDGEFTEPLLLFTMTFQAIGAGTANVGLESDLGDPNQGLLITRVILDPFSIENLQVDLDQSGRVDISDVPEPATWLMLVSVLGLLAVRRLR